jgi:hypothetical protein
LVALVECFVLGFGRGHLTFLHKVRNFSIDYFYLSALLHLWFKGEPFFLAVDVEADLSGLVVEQEGRPRVPPLIVVVVVAEPVVVSIVDEAGFFPCFEAIISRMTNITANLARHVCVHDLGSFHVG